MGSKEMGADVNVAWPSAQIAVMGAAGAVGFVYRQELSAAAKEGKDAQEVEALRLQLQQTYEDTLVNPYIAAERGYVDAVIPPSHTRGYIGTALRLLERKITQIPPKKHGNIPL
jgi:propionyl-CoA carboxylase beta chain